jgi:hypothetical protein
MVATFYSPSQKKAIFFSKTKFEEYEQANHMSHNIKPLCKHLNDVGETVLVLTFSDFTCHLATILVEGN